MLRRLRALVRRYEQDTEGRLRLELAATKAALRDALQERARERAEAAESLRVVNNDWGKRNAEVQRWWDEAIARLKAAVEERDLWHERALANAGEQLRNEELVRERDAARAELAEVRLNVPKLVRAAVVVDRAKVAAWAVEQGMEGSARCVARALQGEKGFYADLPPLPGDALAPTEAPQCSGEGEALNLIVAERRRQDEQWGGPDHDDEHDEFDWLRFIDRQTDRMRRESIGHEVDDGFVKIGALAVAALASRARKRAGRAAAPTEEVSRA